MNIELLTQKVFKILEVELDLDLFLNIKLTDHLKDDLEADELDLIELFMAFEEEFAIDIPDDDVVQLKTVVDCINYLGHRLNVHNLPSNSQYYLDIK